MSILHNTSSLKPSALQAKAFHHFSPSHSLMLTEANRNAAKLALMDRLSQLQITYCRTLQEIQTPVKAAANQQLSKANHMKSFIVFSCVLASWLQMLVSLSPGVGKPERELHVPPKVFPEMKSWTRMLQCSVCPTFSMPSCYWFCSLFSPFKHGHSRAETVKWPWHVRHTDWQ